MTIDPALHFSPDYARARFLQASEARGARIESHVIAARSSTGDELSIDVSPTSGPMHPSG